MRDELLVALTQMHRCGAGALDMDAEYAGLLLDAICGRPQGHRFVRDIEKSLGTLDATRSEDRANPNKDGHFNRVAR